MSQTYIGKTNILASQYGGIIRTHSAK